MLHKFLIFLAIISSVAMSCKQGEKSEQNKVSRTADSLAAGEAVLSKHAQEDSALVSDAAEQSDDLNLLEKIQSVLPVILEKELVGADSSARRFIYYITDLNDDGKNETFIGFTGMNWCGSGGCTALLLSSDLKLITFFTVSNFPFIILNDKSKEWKNLVVRSGGANRILRWNGKSYPPNPSVAPKFTGKLGGDAVKALNDAAKPSHWSIF